ncbi:hypothetical protein LVO79_21155 (plasmid) [Roseivivax marinus]|uniref:hypothetical protein n=1 Tax=Roseivivax marinus TaxID=1379903 RepID=UPI001F047D16|nr:hypothetical protein [Roseivivax marinus]UMA67304.1 hypothetical protein LVO79_21155 [Roseivivax marinus]
MHPTDPKDELTINIDDNPPTIKYTMTVAYWQPEQAEKGNKRLNPLNLFSRFWELEKTKTIHIDLAAGIFNGHNVFELGSFELVDYHQWSGKKPYELKTRPQFRDGHDLGSKYFMSEPPLWDISTVNVVTGERVIVILSHCHKDKLFALLNRINMLLDYTRMICKPWEDLIHEGKTIPIEELREQLEDNPPRFRFTPLERRPQPKSESYIWYPDMQPKPKPDIPRPNQKTAKEHDISKNTLLLMILIPLLGVIMIVLVG